MPLFDTMYYDQKYSLWDTFRAFGRNLKAYKQITSYKLGIMISSQNRNSNIKTAQEHGGKIITAGEE